MSNPSNNRPVMQWKNKDKSNKNNMKNNKMNKDKKRSFDRLAYVKPRILC